MANRVTQDIKMVVVDVEDRAVRVTQDVKMVIADAGNRAVRVTQAVKFVLISQGAIAVYQEPPTFSDTDTFPSGGMVVPGLLQLSTFVDGDTFPSGGVLAEPPAVVQDLTFSDSDTFPSGGMVTAPEPPPSEPESIGTVGRGILQAAAIPAANQATVSLEREAELGREFVRRFARIRSGPGMSGLGDLGPNESLAYNQRRFDNTAPEKLGKMLNRRGKLVTPDVGADHVLTSFTVPTGYWCRLQSLYCTYTGTGFVDGSGDIEWRLQIGSVYARNMAAIQYELGTPGCWFPISDYILIPSGRLVRLLVQVYNVSGLIQIGNSYILGGLQGYLVPQGSIIQR